MVDVEERLTQMEAEAEQIGKFLSATAEEIATFENAAENAEDFMLMSLQMSSISSYHTILHARIKRLRDAQLHHHDHANAEYLSQFTRDLLTAYPTSKD